MGGVGRSRRPRSERRDKQLAAGDERVEREGWDDSSIPSILSFASVRRSLPLLVW